MDRLSVRRSAFVCLLCGAVLALTHVAQALGAQPASQRLIHFELEDQFGRSYNRGSFGEKGIVIFGRDREGSRYREAWSGALSNALEDAGLRDGFAFVDIADLRSAPSFMRRMVRSKFPTDKKKWSLMDWQGAFAEAYELVPRSCNILVFDRAGSLLYRTYGTNVDRAEIDAIVAALTG